MSKFYGVVIILLVLAVFQSSSGFREVPQNVKIFGVDAAEPDVYQIPAYGRNKHHLITGFREVPQNVRIFGGDAAEPGQFPFSVSLQMLGGNVHWCGGSIIHKNWILTAAQCLAYLEPYDVTVLAGTTTLNSTGISFNIDTIVLHPDYSYKTIQNDIALGKIVGEFTFSDSVQAIGTGETTAGDSATVIGWGASEKEDSTNDLRFAEVSVLTEEDCGKRSEGGTYVFERGEGQLCALASGGVAPCHGDSGGPLVFNGTLVGIISYGVTPCAKSYPDVYTKVSYYADWIKNITDGK